MVLGRVSDAYGLQGWLKIHAFGDDPDRWHAMPVWWLREDRPSAPWRAYPVQQFRLRGMRPTVKFEGIDDRAAAERCKGWLVGAPRERWPDLTFNEFYWGDLVGLRVVNLHQEVLGEVAGLIETPANAVLRVAESSGGEQLIPFVDAVVKRVDPDEGVLVVEWERDWS